MPTLHRNTKKMIGIFTVSHLNDLIDKSPKDSPELVVKCSGERYETVDNLCKIVYGMSFAEKRQQSYDEYNRSIGKSKFMSGNYITMMNTDKTYYTASNLHF